ncbi:spheroidene monooxygenase [Roseibacterium sp. SDUM158017]|uniref:spheroidene monooxygenase n=1 Tax=Roseicyclus salinarum TaxID=3036773 RepID=UPI00241516ED|nr:spheroidene monooxygenase [Roseibacterium sp. SDUM158017]MDG4646909.1 spheroidene monooxygenase [Roseibacterium sp. SDUM158017]
MQSVTLSLFRFGSLSSRLWAFSQMATARFALGAVRDLQTFKLCGSGTGEGFTPIPNTAVYAILATWPDHDAARRAMFGTPVFRRYRARAGEVLTIFLTPASARGRWAGAEPFTPADIALNGPVAALTRATVKPSAALKFWKHEPGVSDAIGRDPNVMFKIGIGEVPWMQQVTFSVWPDTATMARFARADGPHDRAIRAVREGGWFREELYARFRLDAVEGTWDGAEPDLTHRPESKTPDPIEVAAE